MQLPWLQCLIRDRKLDFAVADATTTTATVTATVTDMIVKCALFEGIPNRRKGRDLREGFYGLLCALYAHCWGGEQVRELSQAHVIGKLDKLLILLQGNEEHGKGIMGDKTR